MPLNLQHPRESTSPLSPRTQALRSGLRSPASHTPSLPPTQRQKSLADWARQIRRSAAFDPEPVTGSLDPRNNTGPTGPRPPHGVAVYPSLALLLRSFLRRI